MQVPAMRHAMRAAFLTLTLSTPALCQTTVPPSPRRLLFGGLEQGVALPSLSWLVGVRTKNGAEFGVGPGVTPVGAALAVAAGMTFRAGVLNVPVNLAVVPSKSGVRVSVLSGFSVRRW